MSEIYNKKLEDWYLSVILRKNVDWSSKVKVTRKENLQKILRWGSITKREHKFLEYLLKNFDSLIIGSPEILNRFILKSKQCGLISLRTSFSDKIQKALSYNSFKTHLGKEIVIRSGVKVCPYCQMQYTLVTTNRGRHVFEYDHFFPQKQYPYLAVSLYNLIPACGNCNRIKKDDIKIIPHQKHPYLGATFFNLFKYQINKESIIYEYIKGTRQFEIEIKKVNGLLSVEDKELDAYLEKFSINGLMNRHFDLAEEIVQKRLYYSQSKKRELTKICNGKLFKSNEDLERFIVGNYTNPKDHLKRPLAKFQTDIAKQLKLI